MDNAGQGLTGTDLTTAVDTKVVPNAGGQLVFDVTAIINEIIARPGWNPGNAIVLYLLNNNSQGCDVLRNNSDDAGLLEMTFSGTPR
jgi:hypothetical protein